MLLVLIYASFEGLCRQTKNDRHGSKVVVSMYPPIFTPETSHYR